MLEIHAKSTSKPCNTTSNHQTRASRLLCSPPLTSPRSLLKPSKTPRNGCGTLSNALDTPSDIPDTLPRGLAHGALHQSGVLVPMDGEELAVLGSDVTARQNLASRAEVSARSNRRCKPPGRFSAELHDKRRAGQRSSITSACRVACTRPVCRTACADLRLACRTTRAHMRARSRAWLCL